MCRRRRARRRVGAEVCEEVGPEEVGAEVRADFFGAEVFFKEERRQKACVEEAGRGRQVREEIQAALTPRLRTGTGIVCCTWLRTFHVRE
jgi:hypothetical protein